MSIEWLVFFQYCNNDVRTMWNKFENKLGENIKKFTYALSKNLMMI